MQKLLVCIGLLLAAATPWALHDDSYRIINDGNNDTNELVEQNSTLSYNLTEALADDDEEAQDRSWGGRLPWLSQQYGVMQTQETTRMPQQCGRADIPPVLPRYKQKPKPQSTRPPVVTAPPPQPWTPPNVGGWNQPRPPYHQPYVTNPFQPPNPARPQYFQPYNSGQYPYHQQQPYHQQPDPYNTQPQTSIYQGSYNPNYHQTQQQPGIGGYNPVAGQYGAHGGASQWSNYYGQSTDNGQRSLHQTYEDEYAAASVGIAADSTFSSSLTTEEEPAFPSQSEDKNFEYTEVKSNSRIVGGRPARAHSWPWQVAIVLFDRHTACGGSLITNRHILTAAHCVKRHPSPSTYTIHLGSHSKQHRERGEQQRRVIKITIHPKYGNPRLAHDVAIMEMDTPVQFSRIIKPICLADRSPRAGIPCIVTGWGKTKGTGNANILQQLVLPVLPEEQCHKSYPTKFHRASNFCAGYIQGKKDSCSGDSGGPVVCHIGGGVWSQFGVVNWGEGCAQKNKPGVYADVAVFRSWIVSVVTRPSGSWQ